jgi:hypothetical protein
MRTIRFQRCWPVGLDQHFEIPGIGIRWYVDSAADGKSDQSQDSNSSSISGHHWSIVEWTASHEPVTDIQRLDIKIYRPHRDFLLLLLMEVFVKNALDYPSNLYGHVFISEMKDCVNCLVRVAMTRWSQVNDSDGDSAPMNHGKKRGGIKYPLCAHGREGNEVSFELIPDVVDHERFRSRKLSWGLFRKKSSGGSS